MIKAIIITGPTASGKSDISIRLAEKLGGEIVSCDSMQIYKGMDIGTAKPTKEEMRDIPHHMLDIIEPWDVFDVVEYKNMATNCIKDIASRGKVPIVTGGTGLYVNTLVENINYTLSEGDTGLRERLYEYAEKNGPNALHNELKRLDPKAAEIIHANNIKRVVRAIELSHITGKSHEERIVESHSLDKEIDFTVFAVDTNRELLYKRIEMRVDKMIEMGLVDEVITVRDKCVEAYKQGISSTPSPSKTALQAIGYKEIIAYLDNRSSLKESTELIKLNTRHYAKRQITWFKKPLWVRWVTLDELAGIYNL